LTGINNTIEDRSRSLNMPLQLRRGTTAERTTIRPVVDELIYDTDIKSVYVGDSEDGGLTGTLGGVGITVFGVEQAQDAVAAALAAGTHSGISFTYNDVLNKIDAVVGGGTVNLDIKGSVFSDDTSVILIDGVLAAINLDQTIKSNVIPAVDVTYDLGSASKRFKDLYLSGSSINLGNATITATGAAVNLPVGSTVGGITIGSGDGVVSGSNYNINIVGDDSSVIVNASNKQITGTFNGDITGSVFMADSSIIVDSVDGVVYATTVGVHYGNVFGNIFGNVLGNLTGNVDGNVTGNLTGNVTGNITGYHTGDVKGSLFGDDSSIIVDAVSNSVMADSFNTGDVQLQGNADVLNIGTSAIPVLIRLTAQEGESIAIYSRTDGLFDGGSPIGFYGQSGTYSAPLKIAAEGSLGGLSFNGYNGSVYKLGAAMLASVPAGVDTTGDAFIATDIIFATSNGTLAPSVALTIRRDQVAEASCFRATPFADVTARNTAIPTPEAGMVAYLTSTNKLQVYNGAGWVDLH
jgi:hypothetical protein